MTASQQPAATDVDRRTRALIAGFPARLPLRAAAFIVTLYGDVVVPLGGTLWMGNVIEACAGVGISETLVRTAVSRLVAAGRLAGSRAGRRSFYSLTAAARAEFERAADILYAGPDSGRGGDWTLVLAAGGDGRAAVEALASQGFGVAAAGVALRPGSEPPVPGPGAAPLVFQARLADPTSVEALRALARSAWDLEGIAEEYRGFVELFAPLGEPLPDGDAADGGLALTLRLLLVHAYRRTALRDPRLPAAALPEDWPGHAARRLFATAYRRLSPAADAHVARHFVDENGRIGASGDVLQRRLLRLAGQDTA